jgi:hypothetical protein
MHAARNPAAVRAAGCIAQALLDPSNPLEAVGTVLVGG